MAFICLRSEIYKIGSQVPQTIFSNKEGKHFYYLTSRIMGTRDFFTEALTRNLELISKEKISLKRDGPKVPIVTVEQKRPLAVVFEWISADKKVFYKYAHLYLDRGYDVLAVSLNVKQLLLPVSGAQAAAGDVLEFLRENHAFNSLLVHGFSIGGYVWGEVLVKMDAEHPKYQPIIDSIKGQVWDSTPDVNDFYKGFPRAVFPNNALLRFAVEKSISYHLRLFEDSATRHYRKSSQLFYDTPVKAPALIFIAKNDPVASYDTVVKLKEYWESLGRKVHLKSWEKSKHVSHLRFHQEDYIKTLNTFLTSIDNKNENEPREGDKMQAKL